MKIKVNADFPEKLQFLFRPARYKVAYGGRGGGRSWGFARACLLIGVSERKRILCARELQNSIKESVHRLLSDQIELLGLGPIYSVKQNFIVGVNGTEFIFKGLRTNAQEIKSMEGFDILWVEEAEAVSDESWQIVIPTIRKEGSEIWVGFNPDEERNPTYQRFIINPPPDAVVVKLNWRDNPWLPEVLRREKDYLARVDVDAYLHVWEGECRKSSAAQILSGKWVVEYFEPRPEWDGPYHGSDLGFAQDPTTLLRCWIDGSRLYVEELLYQIGLEIDAMSKAFTAAGQYPIRMDNSRPETISYLKRQGLNVSGCRKGQGSVEDGIAFLRGFEKIVIHSEAKHVQEEARLYCYKVDRLSGDIMPEIVDAHNHCWDAVRYALEPVMKNAPGLRWDLS